ncbi:MAG: S-adenosylmethionine decarboxylase [Magnetococcales bacterium]|nr:S-adenosylmethionine decarboxylase [Magnetococcales bacterium]
MVLKHQHLIIQAGCLKPLTSTEAGIQWVSQLTEEIGMTLFMPPQAGYSEMAGNRGLTVLAAITTSHIALHLWDEEKPAQLQLDIYSCKHFELDVVFDYLKKTVQPVDMHHKFLDRSGGLKEC